MEDMKMKPVIKKKPREKKTELPVKRMYANEREMVLGLAVAKDILAGAKDALAVRLRTGANMARDLGCAKSALDRVVENLLLTAPDEQRRSIVAQLAGATYTMGAKSPGIQNKNNEFGRWLSYNELNTMLVALNEHCLVCSRDMAHQAACPLKKVLDTMGYNREHKYGECSYRDSIGGGIDPCSGTN